MTRKFNTHPKTKSQIKCELIQHDLDKIITMIRVMYFIT